MTVSHRKLGAKQSIPAHVCFGGSGGDSARLNGTEPDCGNECFPEDGLGVVDDPESVGLGSGSDIFENVLAQ